MIELNFTHLTVSGELLILIPRQMEANPKPFLNYGCCITIRNDGSWCSFWASN